MVNLFHLNMLSSRASSLFGQMHQCVKILNHRDPKSPWPTVSTANKIAESQQLEKKKAVENN